MPNEPIKILLVEDNPGDVRLLREAVAEIATPRLEWVSVDRLGAAKARLEEEHFDVVLLDLSLPDSHGFETYCRLHAHTPEAPIVVLTSLDDEELAVKTVQAGAQDYLVKTSLVAPLLIRALRYAIERRQLYQIQEEIAQTLQRSLLPSQLPRIPGVELSACYRPTGKGMLVGGDFYDVYATPDGCWVLVIGDVVGKGPTAAAVTALARHTLRAVAMYEQAPSRILFRTNEAILPQLDEESYCTIGCARLEPTPTGARVTFASGGHPLPLLLRSRGGKERTATVEAVGQSGMLVGLVPDLKAVDQVVDLGPGDALLFYTDGVTEARTQDGFLGEERLAALVERCADMDVHRMVAWIERAVFDLQTSDRRDDIAIVALHIPDQFSTALRERLPEPDWMRGVGRFNARPGLSSAPL